MSESRTYTRPKPVMVTCCYCGKEFEADPWPEDINAKLSFAEKAQIAELALDFLADGVPVECGTCLPQPAKESE